MKKIIAISLFICALQMPGFSQDISLYFMNGIWQKRLMAPAHYVPDHRVSIGLPGLGFQFYNNGPRWKDWGTIQDGVLTLSPKKALENIREENYINYEYNFETFHIAYRYNDHWRWSLHHSSHTIGEFVYPGDLVRLMAYGNGNYLNQEMNIGMGINFSSYSELGIGGIYSVASWDIGARVGLLFGSINLQTRKHELSLYTYDDYYQLRLKGNYEIRSSGFPSISDIGNAQIGGLLKTFVPGRFSNLGLSLSTGVAYHPSEVLTISLSVKDLGFIHWSKQAQTQTLSGEYSFEGLDVFNVGNYDTADLKNLGLEDIQNLIDSLKHLLNPSSGNSSYNSTLPVKMALTGSYRLTDKFTVSAMYRYVRGNLVDDHQLAIDASYNFFNHWQLGAMYSVYSGSQNIGFHSNLDLGPIQIFLASDKLFSFGGSGKSYRHLRGGLNIAF